ncbi:MAG: N-acetylneuraminate synthase [Verrucomicrobiaceae bacterium]|nr:MAG: N-acetylneuraminate synthase [Verrucomicrobiaceae bacterium]
MKPTFVIAEIGINHNGDLNIAKKLVDAAVNAGCQAVKFQKRTIDKVYTQEFLDQYRESPWGKTQRDQKSGLEFGKAEYDAIDDYCRQSGIEWFASAWDADAQIFLRQYNLKYNKIASAMLTRLDFLDLVAGEGKHTFISTGMSTIGEIDKAVDVFRRSKCSFELMHSNSSYPARKDQLNLRVMKTLHERYGVDVGYSGHEQGRVASLAAAAMGASSLERHITLDVAMYGSDQAASLSVRDLARLIEDIRTIEKARGDGVKRITDEEMAVRIKLVGSPPAV